MRILKKFIKKLYHLIWFLGAFVLFSPRVNAIVNIGGTAFEQSPQVNFYDNTGGTLTSKGAGYYSAQGYWVSNDNIITNGANIDGANIAFTINGTFIAGYTYSLSVLIGMESSAIKASNARVCIAENTTNASIRYQNTGSFPCSNAFSIVSMTGVANFDYNGYSMSYGMITYVFTADFTSPTVTFAYQTVGNNNSRHIFGGYNLQTIAQPINGLTQSQVQSIINNSGLATANSVSQVQSSINQIQQDINSSADNIINSNEQNTQDIINNQNSNTEQQIESQKVCKDIDKNSISIDNKTLNNSGILSDSSIAGVTNYININKGSLELLTQTSTINAYMCFYNTNKSIIGSCISTKSASLGSITIPAGATYFRATIVKSENKPTFRVCQNGNQALNDSVNDLNDNITDSNVDSSDSSIDNLKDKIPTNSVISDLLLLPVRFLQNFVNALGSSCSRFSLGSLYGTELFMPCINIESYLGSGIWTTIDLIISGMFVYALRKKFIEIYENLTNLKNGGNEVD